MKWQPLAAMVVLIGLAIWLVLGTSELGPSSPDAVRSMQLRVGTVRGQIELIQPDGGEPSFRVMMPNKPDATTLSGAEVRQLFGDEVVELLTAERRNWLFKLFNITNWWSMLWIAIGLLGQSAFLGRMLVQWLVSERRGESVVPEVFWWLSLVGAVALFSYFVWRRDIVGVLGQTTGVVVYARNLRLISRAKRVPAA